MVVYVSVHALDLHEESDEDVGVNCQRKSSDVLSGLSRGKFQSIPGIIPVYSILRDISKGNHVAHHPI